MREYLLLEILEFAHLALGDNYLASCYQKESRELWKSLNHDEKRTHEGTPSFISNMALIAWNANKLTELKK